MANGDVVKLDYQTWEVKALDGQVATSVGAWAEIPPVYARKTISTSSLEEGAADATLSVQVRNDETKPADATAGTEVVTFTSAGAQNQYIERTDRWWKVVKTGGTTPIATTVLIRAGRN